MQPLHYQNVVLNHIQAAAADLVITGHVIAITDCPNMDGRTLEIPFGGSQVAVTGVPSEWSLTCSAAVIEFMQVTISQTFLDGRGVVTQVFEYTAGDPTSPTAQAAAFAAIINLNQNLDVTATPFIGVVTIIANELTSALLTITTSTGGNVALVQTTTGVAQINQGAQLIAAGVTDAVAGNTYTSWTFVPSNIDPTASQGSELIAANQVVLYLNDGDANYAALQAALVTAFTTTFPII